MSPKIPGSRLLAATLNCLIKILECNFFVNQQYLPVARTVGNSPVYHRKDGAGVMRGGSSPGFESYGYSLYYWFIFKKRRNHVGSFCCLRAFL
jgi:hypothetical protein